MAVIKYIGKYVNAEDAIASFDYLEIEKKLCGLSDLKSYINEKQSLQTFLESTRHGTTSKDTEVILLNYIRR